MVTAHPVLLRDGRCVQASFFFEEHVPHKGLQCRVPREDLKRVSRSTEFLQGVGDLLGKVTFSPRAEQGPAPAIRSPSADMSSHCTNQIEGRMSHGHGTTARVWYFEGQAWALLPEIARRARPGAVSGVRRLTGGKWCRLPEGGIEYRVHRRGVFESGLVSVLVTSAGTLDVVLTRLVRRWLLLASWLSCLEPD